MLPRILEPEVMDTAREASDYDRMDHSVVNTAFVDQWLESWRAHAPGRRLVGCQILDVGTGTAQIPIELARREMGCRIIAVDLATEMLKLAVRNIDREGVSDTVSVELVDAKSMPWPDHHFDAVVSNSIIHHIPAPGVVLDEMLRVLKPGGMLFARDLVRPDDAEQVESLVDEYAGEESDHAKQLFRQSFHAALTLEEMRHLVSERGGTAESVQMSSDRHWTVCCPKP